MKDKPYRVQRGRRNSGRRWLWIVLGLLGGLILILGSIALGYYLWLDSKVSAANERVSQEVHEALDEHPTGSTTLGAATAEIGPDAMNILLLGSDTRSGTVEGSRSDTIILVHVDPTNDYLSILSLPRDLRVEIDGHGTRKLNYAYATGGVPLTIRTVQEVTGVDIDHVLQVDFAAFTQMTDKLGGVYVEVDRRYLYNGAEYEKIDLEPGYRLLDGADALDFVRFRHDDNADFGRMERQQRFLNALRQQAIGWDLGLKLPGLVGAFFDNVATNISTNEFLRLARWIVGLDGSRIREVSLRGFNRLSGGVTFVFWEQEDMESAVSSLLTPPGVDSSSSTTTSTTEAAPSIPAGATPDNIPNAAIWRKVAEMAPFAIEAPAYVPEGYRLSARSKTYAYFYDIDTGRTKLPVVVMLYRNTRAGSAGEVKLQDEYINVTATTWLDAPAASQGAQVRYDGTTFNIVGTAGRVERVWWKRNGVLYWVANSLSRVTSGAELLAAAQSMISIPVQ